MNEISQIMSTRIIQVRPNTPICEVIELLVMYDITGMPVVNEDGTLAGIVTEKDVMSLLRDGYAVSDVAADYMTGDVVCFDEQADLEAVRECLASQPFRRVPILRK
jgi:CBS domain-containing protein